MRALRHAKVLAKPRWLQQGLSKFAGIPGTSRPQKFLQILRGRAPLQASASHQSTVAAAGPFRICGNLWHQSASGIPANSAGPRVLSLHWTSVKPCQNPWRLARNVGPCYSRFFGDVILPTDESKCNESHTFSNRQNPCHHPIRKNRITPHFGQCCKNLSDSLDTGQYCHTSVLELFWRTVLVQGMIPNGQACRNSAKFLPHHGHQIPSTFESLYPFGHSTGGRSLRFDGPNG